MRVSVVVSVVEKSSCTEVNCPRAPLNWGNTSSSFHSVKVEGTGVLVVNGPDI